MAEEDTGGAGYEDELSVADQPRAGSYMSAGEKRPLKKIKEPLAAPFCVSV